MMARAARQERSEGGCAIEWRDSLEGCGDWLGLRAHGKEHGSQPVGGSDRTALELGSYLSTQDFRLL